MNPLPRYVKGRYGNLTYGVLNAAFTRIDDGAVQLKRLASIVKDQQIRLPLGPYLSIITARSGTTNATYSADTLWYPHFSVSSATPVNRTFDTATVTYNAAAVDDLCLMMVEEDQATISLIVFETISVVDCEGAALDAGVIAGWQYFG
jgi:hypothetical protein